MRMENNSIATRIIGTHYQNKQKQSYKMDNSDIMTLNILNDPSYIWIQYFLKHLIHFHKTDFLFWNVQHFSG